MTTKSENPRWVLHPNHASPRARELAETLGAPRAFGQVLVNRGLTTAETARRFLEPSPDHLHDPRLLLDLDRATDRVRRAIANRERILVQGDYDVDGVTSTFVLTTALRELGADVHWRIPHRTREGYGLSLMAVEEAAALQCTLIVTVDCGITAIEPVEHARVRGIDTVVTDHHEAGGELPAAVALVDPNRPGCPYPFRPLAGVGVTFKLVEALFEGCGGRTRALGYLDVVSLGTIADVVPLVGENRVLAWLGLEALNHTQRPGLKALREVAGLADKTITGGHVAFVLAPRINAAGRMGDADQAMRLLLTHDRHEAAALAESLEEDNRRRRALDEEVALDASARVESELGWPDCASILLWSERWHPGVLGIVASRLVERFRRPTVLVALDRERGRGSGRSVPGVDLTRVLDGCGDLLESHGGHAHAAGLAVVRAQLPALRERLERVVREHFVPDDLPPRLEIDADLTLGECDLALARWLERLAPHGPGNPEPLFRSEAVTVESVRQVGEGRHLRLLLRDATGALEAIGFGLGGQADEVARRGRCAAAYLPQRNEWMGEMRLQLKLKEIRVE